MRYELESGCVSSINSDNQLTESAHVPGRITKGAASTGPLIRTSVSAYAVWTISTSEGSGQSASRLS